MHSRISRPIDNHQRRLSPGFITILLLSSFRFLVSRALLSSSSPLLTLKFSEMSASTSCQCTTTSFSDFLASQGTSPCLPSVVLGNEAGDADSIVSALALAYVDSISSGIAKTPIVSIPRNDLCLRREAVVLLDLANVDTSKLHYIDDDDDEAVVLASPKLVTLVDHNRLTTTIIGKDYNWTVTEIIDHHFDEGFHEDVVGDLRNVAFENGRALVASTCTLVAERLLSKVEPPYAADLSIALLGVILLDTVNMQPAAGKGTPRDQSAIDALVSKTDWSSLLLVEKGTDLIHPNNGVIIDTDKLYDKLSASKFDSEFWDQLSVRDALRLDYKRFEAAPTGQDVFGSSSVLMDMRALLDKPNFVTETMSYMREVEIPLLAVLSLQLMELDHSTKRDLLLCGSDERLVNDMANYILTNPEAKTAMQPEEKLLDKDTGALVVRHFRQGNLKASRKQVAPIMLHFFATYSSSKMS